MTSKILSKLNLSISIWI